MQGLSARRHPWLVAIVLIVAIGNVAAIVWLWAAGGNVTGVDDAAELVTSLARLTGLLGAWLLGYEGLAITEDERVLSTPGFPFADV